MAQRTQTLTNWTELNQQRPSHRYTCGWCDSTVGSVSGFDYLSPNRNVIASVRLCPNCGYPTFMDNNQFVPAGSYGDNVEHLSPKLAGLYGEARDCVSVSAYHAAVMVGRKIVMHVAVEQGAVEGLNFVAYVDYLVKKNLVPPGTKEWVDEIRQVGNDANHEIFDIGAPEAHAVVDFVAMLMRLLYEFPAKGAASVAARAAKDAPRPDAT